MQNRAITIENLSKSYIIKHQQAESYSVLRDVLSQKAKSVFRKKAENIYPSREEFFALKDVSFGIEMGDKLGIIGRNGAGKSTLLKILSRITEPSAGRVVINGRVASLLEVGTGFHPELSGRENIHLNGSILGMTKKEIESKFDEIVGFAEIERFLDTPVKRYSSGMYVRLAFAVAAHMEPEILIVDEVLAVGDSVFQKKCIDKMVAFGREGRTIIFVSHNISTVEALCSKAILLDKGKLIASGDVKTITELYNQHNVLVGTEIDLENIERSGSYKLDLIFKKIRFHQLPVKSGGNILFDIQIHSNMKRNFSDLDFGINIMDKRLNCIVHCTNRFIHKNFSHNDDGVSYQFEIENNLKPGHYSLVLFLRAEDVIQDVLNSQIGFEIADGNPYGFNDSSQIQGAVMPGFSIKKII